MSLRNLIRPIDFKPVSKCGHDEWMKRVDWKKTVDIIPDKGDNESVIQKFIKTNNTSNKANMARNTKTYNVNGKDQSLKELAKSSGINIATLRARVARGIKGDALVEASVRGGSSRAKTFAIDFDGVTKFLTLKEIAKQAGPNVPVATIRARVARGLQGMNLITGNNPANANRGKTYKVADGSVTMELTINQIAEKYDISPATVRARAKKNFSPVEMIKGKEKKLSTPKSSKTKVQKTVESTKPTMTAEELIAGLEKERDQYVAEKQMEENKIVNTELEAA